LTSKKQYDTLDIEKENKMIKVFSSNSKVIHKWAEQSQQEGRNSHRNIFFEGNTIYSYGKHYPMATIYNNVILVNSESYSQTTQSHIGQVGYIVKQYLKIPIIKVLLPTELKSKENLKHIKSKIHSLHKILKRSYTHKQWHYEDIFDLLRYYRILYNIIYNSNKSILLPNIDILTKYEKEVKNINADKKSRTINNVLIPKPLFKKIEKKTLKPMDIFKERNTQRRAVLLGIYTYERLLKDMPNKLIHQEGEYELRKIFIPKTHSMVGQVGEVDLYGNNTWKQVEIKLPEDIMMLKVKCPSTGVYYVLRVPLDMQRCKQALAWTFDMPEKAYELEMET